MEQRIQLVKKRLDTDVYKTRKNYLASNIRKLDEYIKSTEGSGRKNVKTRRNFAIDMRDRIRREYESLESALPAPVIADSFVEEEMTPTAEPNNESVIESVASLAQPMPSNIAMFERSLAGDPPQYAPENYIAEAPTLPASVSLALPSEAAPAPISTPAPVPVSTQPPTSTPADVTPTEQEKEALLGIEEPEEEIIQKLELEHAKCLEQCKEMQKEINERKAGKLYEYELASDANLFDLLHKVVLYPGPEWNEHIKQLVEIRHDVKGGRLSGPSYFEALFQLGFYLGIFPGLAERKREFYDKHKNLETNFLYNTQVQSGGGAQQGISDITFKLVDDGERASKKNKSYVCGEYPEDDVDFEATTYYISVKRYTKEKSPKYYDIGELFTFIAKKAPNTDFRLCICCKDKKEFLKRMKSARSDYLVTSVNKIYGFVDQHDDMTGRGQGLLQLFENKRNEVFSNMAPSYSLSEKSDITEDDVKLWIEKNFPQNKPILPSLALYFHQELVVESAIIRIQEQQRTGGSNNYVCIGVLPRGGKSFIAGGILKRLLERKKTEEHFWVLFMTSAISETMSQFEDDLIKKFSDFKDFDFVDPRKYTKQKPYKLNPAKPNPFVFVSRELLTGVSDVKLGDEEKDIAISNKQFKNIFEKLGFGEGNKIPFQLVMFDEAHKGGITSLTRNAINTHINGNPPFVLMTATYKKLADSLRGYIHSANDLFIWDLDDIQLMKKLPVLGLDDFEKGEKDEYGTLKQYGLFRRYNRDLILSIIQQRVDLGQSLETIVKPYNDFPEPYFLSATFTPEIIEKIQLSQRGGGREGFNIKEHFEHKSLTEPDVRLLIENPKKWYEWYKILKNIPKAIALRSYLTPNDDGKMLEENNEHDQDIKIDPKAKVLNRIFSITQKKMGVNARPGYGTPFSILMFLPTGDEGQRIGATSRAWGSLLLNAPYWRDNFVVLGLSEFTPYKEQKSKTIKPVSTVLPTPSISTVLPTPSVSYEGGYYNLQVMSGGGPLGDDDSHIPCLKRKHLSLYCSEEDIDQKDLKSKIVAIERAALKERKGLVILTGQRAAMGISLPCVDLVCLFDDAEEADMIIQKMYRALTDSRGKKYGFIFDFNIRRIFKAKFEYAEVINFSARGAARETAGDLFDSAFNTCLWDTDAWAAEVPSATFNDHMLDIKRKLLGNLENDTYKMYEKDIEKKDIELLKDDDINFDIISILKGGQIGRKPVSETYQQPGINAPPNSKTVRPDNEGNSETEGEGNGEGEGEGNGEDKDNEENEITPKDIDKIKELYAKLTLQFVNLLYIRAFPEGTSRPVSLTDLLRRYDADMEIYKQQKEVGNNLLKANPCDIDNNMYIRLVQDLGTFIEVPTLDVASIDNGEKIYYVGPVVGSEREEDYKKIPIGTPIYFNVKMKDGTYKKFKSIYYLYAKRTINKWTTDIRAALIRKKLVNRREGTNNAWTQTAVQLSDGTYLTLDDFVKSRPDDNVSTQVPIGVQNEMRSRIITMLRYIRRRFGDISSPTKNETFFIYSNYLESFVMSLTKTPPTIQSGGADISATKRYNAILDVIDKRLVPDDQARTKRGEVFTPPDLVRQILFGLRKDKLKKGIVEIWGIDKENNFIDESEDNRIGGLPNSVWRDPTLKWLDPANGIGNFPIIAFYKLDYYLKSIGKKTIDGKVIDFGDPDARRKHIIENMLYMIELDRGNVETSRGLFKKIYPGIKYNILCGNTLEMTEDHLKKAFGVVRFDIFMGNPPYNSGGVKSSGADNYETIWYHFINQSTKKFPGALKLLNKNGYLCLIHPSSWLHINDNAKMNRVLLSYDIEFLRIYTNIQANKLFSGGGTVRVAYYVIKNTEPSDKIFIFDTDEQLEVISRKDISTNSEFTIYQNNNLLLSKVFKKLNRIELVKDDTGKPYLKSEGKLKGNIEPGEFKNITTHKQDGVVVCSSSKPFPYWTKSKIIFKGSSNLFHFDDYESGDDSGHYGIHGNWGYYIIDNVSNLKKFSKFFDTNIAKLIMRATKEDQDFIEPKFLPDIRNVDGVIDDKHLCDLFDIDYEHVKAFTFIQNNQKVALTTDGCSEKKRQAKDTIKKSKSKPFAPKSRYTHKTRKLRRR